MILQSPPATRTWTQEDFKQNGWTTRGDNKEVSPELVSAMQGLGVPHEPANIHDVFAEQFDPFTDQHGHANTPATKGFYNNKYIPDPQKGAIISEANFSPRFRAGPVAEIPPLNRWSDIVWYLWSREAGDQAKNLRYIFRDKTNNGVTRAIIDHINGLEEHPDTLDLPWPGHTYDMRTDDGKALLGTPHGIGVAFLIADHSNVLARKIPFAHVFTVRNPTSGSDGAHGGDGDDNESSGGEGSGGEGSSSSESSGEGEPLSSSGDNSESEGSGEDEGSSEAGSSSSASSDRPVYKWYYYIVWELRDSARGNMPTQLL
ncbi:MAG: hypothetical protein Q9170_005594 [Blastenia crenularia]